MQLICANKDFLRKNVAPPLSKSPLVRWRSRNRRFRLRKRLKGEELMLRGQVLLEHGV